MKRKDVCRRLQDLTDRGRFHGSLLEVRLEPSEFSSRVSQW